MLRRDGRCSSAVVVGSGAWRPGESTECPDVADSGQSLVLDLPAHDLAAFAAGSGDGGASRVGLEGSGGGEAGAVVADLRQDPGAGQCSETRKAADDRRVRMFLEGLRDGFFELVGVVAGGVQPPEQSGSLMSESLLDLRELVKIVAFEDFVEPFGFGLDAADAAGVLEQRLQAQPGQLRSRCRGRCCGQDAAGFPRAQALLVLGEGVEDRRIEPSELGAKLVAGLAAGPDGVLLSPCEDGDGLDELGVRGQRTVGGHVGSQDVGEGRGVDGVRLLAGDGVVVPVAATASGLIEKTGRPVARRHATSSPRDVSIATGIGVSSLSLCSASRAMSWANPAASSLIRTLASCCPPESTSAMSWCSSAQSTPQNTGVANPAISIRSSFVASPLPGQSLCRVRVLPDGSAQGTSSQQPFATPASRAALGPRQS